MVNAGPAARNSTGFVPLVPAPPIAVPTVKKGDSAVTEVSTDKLLNRPGLPAGASVIVMGDLNDGPGLDEYEKLFGHSGVEIVLGLNSGAEMHLYDPHAHMALAQKTGISPTTARFWLAPQKRYFEALLDFIMVSPDLAARSPDWRIWHPFNDPAVMAIPELRDALLTASDHFPVTIDLEIN